MKKNLNRTVALALAVMLVVCFPFAVSGEEAAAEIPVQTEEVIEVPETVEPAVEENVPQPVSVWIITLNLGSTEFYYDDLMLGANIENATAAGIRWQICKTYNRDGANDWKDYKYDEVIHVTVEPGIENWAFRCILPSGDMSQEFVVTKNFGYRPAEEEITEETIPEESTETTEEMIVESEEIEEETDDDDFVEFEDDELVEFDDNDWGTTEGSDFSELDNLANGVEEAVETESEEIIVETETEEIEEVTEEAETETPAAEAEEIANVVVEEEKEEANEEIEEVTEEAEAETPAAEAEEIAHVVVEEEKEEANEEIEEVTEEAEAETPAAEAEVITNVVVEEEKEAEIEEVTEEAETETPAVEAEALTEEEQTEVDNAEVEENISEETEKITEEIEEVNEEVEIETSAAEAETVTEQEQTEVKNTEIVESIPEAVEVIEGTVTELPAVEAEEITEEEQNEIERYYTITTSIDELGYAMNGDDIILYANLYGYEDVSYTIQWVYSTDTINWITIPDANDLSLVIEANADNFALYWDVIITITD